VIRPYVCCIHTCIQSLRNSLATINYQTWHGDLPGSPAWSWAVQIWAGRGIYIFIYHNMIENTEQKKTAYIGCVVFLLHSVHFVYAAYKPSISRKCKFIAFSDIRVHLTSTKNTLCFPGAV